ncbi:hypothetical protein B0H11DRAFT_2031557 [Mycena galericulata]|nr:hypothetical protein B0H11DRAFT_2031557 [Mycena galericulata]
MHSPLDSSLGIMLVSLFLATILYGIGLTQTFLYFQWYPKDPHGVKAIVICLVAVETLHITFFFYETYALLIDDFGNFAALEYISWSDPVQLLGGYLSAFIVQMYFAYCIYALTPKYKIMPIVIVVLALMQIGGGIAGIIRTMELGRLTLLYRTKKMNIVQATSALLCDMAITVCLCYTLNSKRTTIKSTNSLLNRLMIMAVNRGTLTALSAALNIILFLAIPDTLWFFLGLVLSGKLYMNSLLATLNTRQHVRESAEQESLGWPSFSAQSTTTKAPAVGTATAHATTSKVGVNTFDGFSSETDRRASFTVNMI